MAPFRRCHDRLGPIVGVLVLLAPRPSLAAPVEVEIEEDESEPAPEGTKDATTPAPTEPTDGEDAEGEPSDSEPAPVAEASQQEAALRAELEAMRTRIDELERAEATRRAEETKSKQQSTPNRPAPRPRKWWAASSSRQGDDARPPTSVGYDHVAPEDYGVSLGGYMQVQYQWSQLSEDELQQGGAPLNRNRFMVRRGRLQASGDWQYFGFEFEIDGSTTRGPFIGIRRANLSTVWRNPKPGAPPWIQAIVGLTEVPFGYEVRLGQRELLFMERTAGSLAFFPGPVDVGLRLRGGVGPFRYDVAVMNGTPLDDRAGGPQGVDPTQRPDLAGRLGFEALPSIFALGGGVSFLWGTGFHAGQQSTKNVFEWQDLNENGAFDTGEIVTVPGTAALPSETYGRWAANIDLQLGVRSKIGWATLLGEVTSASNLDRGLFPSDPVTCGSDVRQLQAYGAFIQDLTKWAAIGFRYDYYDYNSDLLDRRRGTFVPVDSGIHTLSPLVAARLPGGIVRGFQGRLVLQYDAVLDHLGRDARGVPANLRNDQLTIRLQGEF